MINCTRFIGALCLVFSTSLLLQSCTPSSQTELGQNIDKSVWMRYSHVANVKTFQVRTGSTTSQLSGAGHGSLGLHSFWAVFDICSIDVRGSALTQFNYNANSFFIEAGSAIYGSTTPGDVNVSSVVMSSQSPLVTTAVRDAFSLSPTTQLFPKQFYPNLKYRIAIFVREYPVGYRGEAMTLKYDGQPQVAAFVQNVSPGDPVFREFYNHPVSSEILGTCPP